MPSVATPDVPACTVAYLNILRVVDESCDLVDESFRVAVAVACGLVVVADLVDRVPLLLMPMVQLALSLVAYSVELTVGVVTVVQQVQAMRLEALK
jgi:hypothetical protein